MTTTRTETVSANTWKPAYRRIADEIARRVQSGAYQPDQRIPQEAEFCAEFDVSKITVKKALEILVNDGLIIRLVGKGTFVRRKKQPEALNVLGSIEELMAEGEESSMEVLSREELPADAEVADQLHIAPGTPVLRIEARRDRFRVYLNGELEIERVDARCPAGRVALAAYTGGIGKCTVYYDNVVVTKLD
jgi:DNA-binding GntR family transcriptional regulator